MLANEEYLNAFSGYLKIKDDLDKIVKEHSDIRLKLSNGNRQGFVPTQEYCDLCKRIKAKKLEYSDILDTLISLGD